MSIKQSDYEVLLCEYSTPKGAISLLKQYRPYLEIIPSLRRPQESIIPIPLPTAKIRYPKSLNRPDEVMCLPCDLVILMCDPQWKIKMDKELLIFIHRPQEDFSDLLMRWRQTQVLLSKDYEWLMTPTTSHMFSEGDKQIHPLFVFLEGAPQRISKGLMGGGLPYVLETMESMKQELAEEFLPA